VPLPRGSDYLGRWSTSVRPKVADAVEKVVRDYRRIMIPSR
jgi:hypothetical protein